MSLKYIITLYCILSGTEDLYSQLTAEYLSLEVGAVGGQG